MRTHPTTPKTLHGHRHAVIDDGEAFLPDFRGGFVEVADGDAEAWGEEFIAAATSAEGVAEDARDEVADDEQSGFGLEVFLDDALDLEGVTPPPY